MVFNSKPLDHESDHRKYDNCILETIIKLHRKFCISHILSRNVVMDMSPLSDTPTATKKNLAQTAVQYCADAILNTLAKMINILQKEVLKEIS